MRKCVVFYAGMVWGEYDSWPSSEDRPDGAFINYMPGDAGGRVWYVIRGAWADVVDLDDVPKELRTICLLLQ